MPRHILAAGESVDVAGNTVKFVRSKRVNQAGTPVDCAIIVVNADDVREDWLKANDTEKPDDV